MKTTKSGKGERRARRKAKDQPRDGQLTMQVLGGTMDPDVFDRVLAAARHHDFEATWLELSRQILPVIKRRHHRYPPDASPLHIQVPPGVWTGFGIDFGPAFSHVTPQLVERWGVDHATLLATALDNLVRLVRDEPPVVQRFDHDGATVIAIGGQGWGSSLVLVPDVLRPILGPQPLTLLAPVRKSLIALPDDVDPDLAMGIWDAIADGAHDELDIDPLRWTGSAVVAIGDPALGLPN